MMYGIVNLVSARNSEAKFMSFKKTQSLNAMKRGVGKIHLGAENK